MGYCMMCLVFEKSGNATLIKLDDEKCNIGSLEREVAKDLNMCHTLDVVCTQLTNN